MKIVVSLATAFVLTAVIAVVWQGGGALVVSLAILALLSCAGFACLKMANMRQNANNQTRCCGGLGPKKSKKNKKCVCQCQVCKVRAPVVFRLQEHVHRTRQTIVSAFASLPDFDATLAWLNQNQTDWAGDISQVTEPTRGAVFEAQNKQWLGHIAGAVRVVTAIIKGDAGDLDVQVASWKQNAQDIADSMSALQPDVWPQATMREMMQKHLETLTTQVVARSKADWVGDLEAQNAVSDHMYEFALFLAPGFVGLQAKAPAAMLGTRKYGDNCGDNPDEDRPHQLCPPE